jgi:hypothetical protein
MLLECADQALALSYQCQTCNETCGSKRACSCLGKSTVLLVCGACLHVVTNSDMPSHRQCEFHCSAKMTSCMQTAASLKQSHMPVEPAPRPARPAGRVAARPVAKDTERRFIFDAASAVSTLHAAITYGDLVGTDDDTGTTGVKPVLIKAQFTKPAPGITKLCVVSSSAHQAGEEFHLHTAHLMCRRKSVWAMSFWHFSSLLQEVRCENALVGFRELIGTRERDHAQVGCLVYESVLDP